MTREDAIKVLNMVEAHGLADEAKRMAIEALEQEPCEDAISRQAVIDLSEKVRFECGSVSQMVSVSKIKELPPVTPQQKVGGWKIIKNVDGNLKTYVCSECGALCGYKQKYCEKCGAKMEV